MQIIVFFKGSFVQKSFIKELFMHESINIVKREPQLKCALNLHLICITKVLFGHLVWRFFLCFSANVAH